MRPEAVGAEECQGSLSLLLLAVLTAIKFFTEESPLPLCICNYFGCCCSSLLSDKMSKFYFKTVSLEMGW